MPIEFKPIATPDFSKTLEALNRAGDSYKDVFKGLQTTLDGVQTNVVNRNNAALEEYINKAATPEELLNPDFQVGLQNLKDSMDKNFSPLDVNKYADTRVDTLRQRANDIFNAQKAQTEYAQQQATRAAVSNLAADPTQDPGNVLSRYPGADPATVAQFHNTEVTQRNAILDRAGLVYALNNPDEPLPEYLKGANLLEYNKYLVEKRKAEAEIEKTTLDNEGTRIANAAQKVLAGQLFGSGNDPTGNNAPKVSLGNIDLSNVPLTDVTRKGIKDSVEKNVGFLSKIRPIVVDSAQRYNLPTELLWAVAHVESTFNPAAKSPVGAGGLMQFMPGTAKRFGVTDVNDPAQAIPAAAKYLSFLLKRYKGDAVKAIAGYNAGEGNVDKYQGVPPFKETQAYVPKVLGRMRFFAEQNGTLTSLGGSNINPAGIGIASNGLFTYSGTPTAGGVGSGGGGSSGGSGSGGGDASGEGAAIGRRPWESTLEGLKYSYAKALSERSLGTAEGQKTAVYTPRFKSQEELSKNYKNTYSLGQNNYVPSIIKSANEIPDFLELPQEDQMHILDTALSTTEMNRWRRDFDAQPSEEYRKMVRKLVDERNQLAKIKAIKDLKATNRLYVTQVAQAGNMRPVEAGRYLGMSDDTLQKIGVLDKDGNPVSLPATWGQAAAPGTPPGATAGATPNAAAGVAAIKEAQSKPAAPKATKDSFGYFRGNLNTKQINSNIDLMNSKMKQLAAGNLKAGSSGLVSDVKTVDTKIASLKKTPGQEKAIAELMAVRKGLIQREIDTLQNAKGKSVLALTTINKNQSIEEEKKAQEKRAKEQENLERIKRTARTPAGEPVPSGSVPETPKQKPSLTSAQLQEWADGKKKRIVRIRGRSHDKVELRGDIAKQSAEMSKAVDTLRAAGQHAKADKLAEYWSLSMQKASLDDQIAQKSAQIAIEMNKRAAQANDRVAALRQADDIYKKYIPQ